MITTVPAEIPVAIPVDTPIVASGGMLLIHKPPGVRSVRFVVLPTHTVKGPVMLAGTAYTVTTVVAIQPVPNV